MSERDREQGFATRALRSQVPPIAERPLAPPLYQSATFAFEDLDAFADVAQRKTGGGYLYTRWANPTTDALARTMASLEGAEGSACFASGMAAIHGTLLSLTRSEEHIVAARQLYGGTHGLFATALARAGITTATVDVTDHRAIERAFTGQTRVLYAETIGNPTLPVADIDVLADIAHDRGALLVLDATFTPPCALRPLEHGADLVVHSATKYLGGHSDVTGGIVSGTGERIEAIRQLQIDVGGVPAPFESWLIARGLQTLSLRWERISDNALALARALSDAPGVASVSYPGLPQHPQHDLAKRLLGDRFGGMIAFEVDDGIDAGRRFLERVQVCSPAASLGGTKTLVVHPASITHTQLSPEQRVEAGVTDGLIRVSVGIEDIDDLIADVKQALA